MDVIYFYAYFAIALLFVSFEMREVYSDGYSALIVGLFWPVILCVFLIVGAYALLTKGDI